MLTNQSFTRTPRGRIDSLLHRLEHRFAVRRFERMRRVRRVGLAELLPGIESVRVTTCGVGAASSIGNMPDHEMLMLSAICGLRRPRRVFEFGTYDGWTTLHLAMNVADGSRVTTIDLPPDHPIRRMESDDTFYTQGVGVGARFRGQCEAERITQLFDNSVECDLSDHFGSQDLVFVDGGHSYDVVRSDSLNALKLLRRPGIVVWHDYYYTQRGVWEWLNEMSGDIEIVNVTGTSLAVHLAP